MEMMKNEWKSNLPGGRGQMIATINLSGELVHSAEWKLARAASIPELTCEASEPASQPASKMAPEMDTEALERPPIWNRIYYFHPRRPRSQPIGGFRADPAALRTAGGGYV